MKAGDSVTARTVTCTFTDDVDEGASVPGSVSITAIGRQATNGAGLDFTTGTDTKFHTGTEITPIGGGDLPDDLYKLHSVTILYRVGASGAQWHANGLSVVDTYDSRTILEKPSINVTVISRNGQECTQAERVDPSKYTVTFDDANHASTVTLNADAINNSADSAYWVNYDVFVDDSVKDGDQLTNTAKSGDRTATHTFTYYRSAGSGSGGIGTISWSKVDDAGAKLSGAEFELTGPNDYRETIADNGDLDQDKSDGSFSVGSLPKSEYSLKDTESPAGHQLSTQITSITLSSGGGMTQAAGTVVNVKEAELTKEPTKEPTTEPSTSAPAATPAATTPPGATPPSDTPPSTTPHSGTLPRTGASVGPAVGAVSALIICGLALVLVGRKRRWRTEE